MLGAEWVFVLVPYGNTKRASAHSLGVKGLQTLCGQGCLSPGGWLLAGMVGSCLEPWIWTERICSSQSETQSLVWGTTKIPSGCFCVGSCGPWPHSVLRHRQLPRSHWVTLVLPNQVHTGSRSKQRSQSNLAHRTSRA